MGCILDDDMVCGDTLSAGDGGKDICCGKYFINAWVNISSSETYLGTFRIHGNMVFNLRAIICNFIYDDIIMQAPHFIQSPGLE